ncbi:MAG: hypothetical protein HY461_01045 [Parcubacteria group bacterium]|nr:hypothetical protein [Parcubacteria group bacterium]
MLEEEVNGLNQYLRALHFLAVILIGASAGALTYAIRVLFENQQHAVIAFIVIILTAAGVILASVLALRPWVLPRFLMPLDLRQLEYEDLMAVFTSPKDYLLLLKKHIEQLTEGFLIPKLARLRHAITILVLGMSIAALLAVALP